MSPPKAARMNINSEYQRQFQPWNKLMQSMPEVAANVSNNAAVPSKKTKVVQAELMYDWATSQWRPPFCDYRVSPSG